MRTAIALPCREPPLYAASKLPLSPVYRAIDLLRTEQREPSGTCSPGRGPWRDKCSALTLCLGLDSIDGFVASMAGAALTGRREDADLTPGLRIPNFSSRCASFSNGAKSTPRCPRSLTPGRLPSTVTLLRPARSVFGLRRTKLRSRTALGRLGCGRTSCGLQFAQRAASTPEDSSERPLAYAGGPAVRISRLGWSREAGQLFFAVTPLATRSQLQSVILTALPCSGGVYCCRLGRGAPFATRVKLGIAEDTAACSSVPDWPVLYESACGGW